MKLRCVRLISPATGEVLSRGSLRVGVEYPVLEIVLPRGENVLVRVFEEEDADTPGLWPVAMFEPVPSRVPANWYPQVDEPGGTIRIGPESWLRSGFWEAYFEGDALARADFQKELRELTGSAGS